MRNGGVHGRRVYNAASGASSAAPWTIGDLRKLVAQAAGMAISAMISPAITGAEALKSLIATPSATEPNAMPTLIVEPGSEATSAPPGPARLTTRNCSDGTMPPTNNTLGLLGAPLFTTTMPIRSLDTPFGGFGQSGLGHEGRLSGLLAFTSEQMLSQAV
ncbi:aldehyde dehydrogenase family protein [Streptosporangium soli]|nr:hypothetical protein [Streptosporangium sp. KLBMP 9127]